MATYDAFISYSHAEDRGVARQLQIGVEKFAKPWHRIRASRIFLDSNSLSADPALWSSVERALADSSWFILVASPRAAASPWVEREIRWWLENRSADRLLIVVSDGALQWDHAAGDFDATASTALPPALLGVLKEEPRWVPVPPRAAASPEASQLDLQETVIDVATAIREIPKEELVGAAAREHRRTLRWVRGAIAVLTVLLVAAVIGGLVALSERSAAIDQAELALSRQIASVSQETANRDLSVSMLLAVEAYKQDPNAQSRAALFAANTASPHLKRFLDAGGKVERLAGTPDGAVVAGLVDGRVILWPEEEGEPQELFHLEDRISSLAISRDGAAVAAADEAQGLLWRKKRGLVPLPVPAGQHTDTVALSPSGETLAYHSESTGFEGAESITVAPTSRLAARSIQQSETAYGSTLVLPSEERLLIFDAGSWEWRRISDWRLLRSSDGLMGAHQYADAQSADGRFFTVTNGAKTIPVWSTAEATPDLGESDFGVEAPVTDQSALALSSDGSKIAVAGSEGIYVAPVVPAQDGPSDTFEAVEPSDPADRPVQLTGQSGVDYGALAFPGDDSRLLSASGSEIALWDLDQIDRLARTTMVPLDPPCSACEGASIAISPDGRRIAITDGFGTAGFLQNLHGDPERKLLLESELAEYSYGLPVWQGDSEFAAYPIEPPAGGSEATLPAELPDGVRAWPGAGEGDDNIAVAIAADGEAVMLVDSHGDVYWQDGETGAVLRRSDGSDSLSLGAESLETAALNSSPELLATLDQGKVTVEDLSNRKVVGSFDVGRFARLAFAGDRLLVQRQDGALEVWDQRGNDLQRTIPGDGTFAWQPVGNADGSMAARRRSDGSVILVDLETGTQMAAFGTREASSFLRTSVTFSPIREDLYMLSEAPGEEHKGELVRRDISDEALVEAACDAAGRDLTKSEWRAFIGTEMPSDLSCP